MSQNFSSAEKQRIIDTVLEDTDPRNQGWMREYLENNIDGCIDAVAEGAPYTHGFRGYDVKEAMEKLGLDLKRGSGS